MNIDLWLEEALESIKKADPKELLSEMEKYGLVKEKGAVELKSTVSSQNHYFSGFLISSYSLKNTLNHNISIESSELSLINSEYSKRDLAFFTESNIDLLDYSKIDLCIGNVEFSTAPLDAAQNDLKFDMASLSATETFCGYEVLNQAA